MVSWLRSHTHLALVAILVIALAEPLGLLLASGLAPITHEQHNWRQADVYSVAYTFHEDGFDFLHPRIDFWRGPTGIVGMEAPVYPTLAHAAMYLVGVHPRAARLVSLLAFFAAMVLAVQHLCPEGLAPADRRVRGLSLLAFALLSPMGLIEFRQIQPDGLAVSGALAAAALFVVYQRTGRRRGLAAGLGIYSVAVITKSPVLVAGPTLFLLAHGWRRPRLGSLALAASFAVPILAGVAWFSWAKHLTQTYEVLNPYFNLSFDANEVLGNLKNSGLREYVFGFLLGSYATGWALFPVCAAGVVLGFRRDERPIAVPMLLWLVFGAFFSAAFAYRTTVHWYYALVAFPPLAYFGSLGFANLLEVGASPHRSGKLDRFAALFVVLALAATLWAGGPAAADAGVPAANGAVFEKTWFTALRLGVLAGFALAALVATPLVKPGWVQRGRAGAHLLIAVALVVSLPRAVHDVVSAFRFRTSADEWTTFDARTQPLVDAVARVSTRRDLFVVDGYNPWFLHLTHRRGFSVDAGTVFSQGVGWYTSRGVRFYVHHAENGIIPPLARSPVLARGEGFEIYCLDPTPGGCPAAPAARGASP